MGNTEGCNREEDLEMGAWGHSARLEQKEKEGKATESGASGLRPSQAPASLSPDRRCAAHLSELLDTQPSQPRGRACRLLSPSPVKGPDGRPSF